MAVTFQGGYGNTRIAYNSLIIAGLMLMVMGMALINHPSAEADALDWEDDRYDLLNSGSFEGVGSICEPIESYRLNEVNNISALPLSVDLDGDGKTELVYTTANGDMVIRTGVDGTLEKRISIGEVITGVAVFDRHSDGILDLIIISTSANDTSIHLIEGDDLTAIKKLIIPNRISRSGGSISDVDLDGYPELVFSTYEGHTYAVDLMSFTIDWEIHVGRRMAGSVAIYNGTDGPQVAVTSGLSYWIWGETGCNTLYIIDGINGNLFWSYEAYGIISTPPTVIREEPTVWIAFGTFVGNFYVLDVENKEIILEMDRREFDGPAFWKHINVLDLSGTNDDILILISSMCQVGLRISDWKIIWEEYFNYPVEITDSLLGDIDGDGKRELIILNESVIPPQKSILRIMDPVNGNIEREIPGLPVNPIGMIVADIDDDESLEILVLFQRNIILLNEERYIIFNDILIDGDVVTNGSKFIQYAMLRPYSIRVDAQLSSKLGYVREIVFTFDTEGSDIRVRYEPFLSKTTEETNGYLIIEEIHTVKADNGLSIILDYYVNWSFPHEEYIDLMIIISYMDGFERTVRLNNLFRVENDIEITGSLELDSNGTSVDNDSWFNSDNSIEGEGLTVIYQGSDGIPVDPLNYRVIVMCGGNTWVCGIDTNGNIKFSLDFSHYNTGNYSLFIRCIDLPASIETNDYSSWILVDNDKVDIIEMYPDTTDWISSRNISIGIVASDSNGSGIDISSVTLRMETQIGIGNLIDWRESGECLDLGNGTMEFRLDIQLDTGVYYIQWMMTDRAKNRPTVSRFLEVKIDIATVVFSDPFPTGWITTLPAELRILVQLESNLTLTHSKFQYAYTTDPDRGWNWIDLATVISESQAILSIDLTLSEGSENYIRWSLYINETWSFISDTVRYRVDTVSPHFGATVPDLEVILEEEPLVIRIPIIDDSSGTDRTTVEYQFSKTNDFSDVDWSKSSIETIDGTVSAVIALDNLSGKENYLRVRAKDLAGNGYNVSSVFRIMINEPCDILDVLPSNGSHFLKGNPIGFSMNYSNPDPYDTPTIEWSSSRQGILGIQESFATDDLSLGRHIISLSIDDGHGHVTTHTFEIDIIKPADDGQSNKLPTWTIVVIVIVIFLSSIFYLKHRKV